MDASKEPSVTHTFTVRRIAADDFEAAADLLAELGRPAITDATRAATAAVFRAHAADPDVGTLIAERDGVAVGLLSLQFRPRLNVPTPEAWIPDLIVRESERGSGVAVALLRRAIELARGRGCHQLTLESAYHRLRAHRFYAREGLTDAGKYFVLSLR